MKLGEDESRLIIPKEKLKCYFTRLSVHVELQKNEKQFEMML